METFNKHRYLILTLFILFYPYFTFSQKNINYDPWDWVTFKNSSYITSISEGNEYIYFASNGGLLRYHLFGKYWDDPVTTSQGLASDELSAVYNDFNTNVLWAASPKGLNYSRDNGQSWDIVDRYILGLRPREKIIAIGSSADYLWLLTSSQIMKLDHLSGYVIIPYADTSEDNIKWGSALLEVDNSASFLDDYAIAGGWISSRGLFSGPDFEEVQVSTILYDRFSDFWVGTWGGPVFYGDARMKQLTPLYTGPAQTNLKVLVATQNGMWLGGFSYESNSTGITYADIERGIWDIYRFGYEFRRGDDQILSGVAVGREIWFGTPQGIMIFDEKGNDWTYLSELNGLPDEFVSSIEYDGNYVYTGTPNGIANFLPNTKKKNSWFLESKMKNMKIYAMHWDGTNLWISTRTSLWRWLPEKEKLNIYGSLGEPIYPMMTVSGDRAAGMISTITAIESSDSIVYFGDIDGILVFNKKKESWSRMTGKSRLIGYRFNTISVSRSPGKNSDLLWLGTNRGAIMSDLASDQVQHYRKKDGLSSDIVTSIIVDEDIVWFGTPEGVVRFEWYKYLE